MNKQIFFILFFCFMQFFIFSNDNFQEKEFYISKAYEILEELLPNYKTMEKFKEEFSIEKKSKKSFAKLYIIFLDKRESIQIYLNDVGLFYSINFFDLKEYISEKNFYKKKISNFKAIKFSREIIERFYVKGEYEELKIYYWDFERTYGVDDFKFLSLNYKRKILDFFVPGVVKIDLFPTGKLKRYSCSLAVPQITKSDINIKISREEAEKIGFDWFRKNYIEEYEQNIDDFVIVKDSQKEAKNFLFPDSKIFIANTAIPEYFDGNPVFIYPDLKPENVFLKELERKGYKLSENEEKSILIDPQAKEHRFDIRLVHPVMIRRKDYGNIRGYFNLETVYVDAELGIIMNNASRTE